MISIKHIKIALITLTFGLLFSCTEDYLYLDPTDSIAEDDVFKSLTTANAALTGAYDQLSSYQFEGLWVPLMADIMGEDVMINSVDNWNWFVQVYQLEVLPNYTYVTYPWRDAYKIIYDANKIIDGAQTVPDASDEDKNQLEGEARVIRAFTMLRLAEMYGPAYMADKEGPSILNVVSILPIDDDLGRAPQREVYETIVSDLTFAIDLLEYQNDLGSKGYFDKRSAQALLARTYLDMGDWEKARDMAKLAYADVQLMALEQLFDGFYYRNSETLFSIAYTSSDNNVFQSIPSFYYPVAGYSSVRANDKFVESFDNMDVRKDYFLDVPEIDENRYLIIKFAHNQQVGNAERICIRASEMYLIEAECEAELGNYTEAQNALWTIQKRANPGASRPSLTGQALIDEILMERRKELFGEGFRWNDIKRRQLPLQREGDHWAKFDFGPQDADYYRLTFPIPQSEIDANGELTSGDQNTGY